MRLHRIVFLLVLALVLTGRAAAQSARWEPPGGSLGLNQVSEVALVFENCEPRDSFALPPVDGLVFGRASVSQQSSISFGTGGRQSTSTYSMVYPVRPTRRAQVRIPAFKVETDRGEVTVAEAVFTVEDAPAGNAGRVTLDDIAQARLASPNTTLWAGEVIPLTYTLSVVRNRYYALDPALTWSPAPFLAEEWSKPAPAETVVRGERRVVSTQTTRVLAKEPGTYSLGPVTQVVQLIVGTSGLSLFAQPIVEPRQLLTAPLDLTVKPLPAAPAEFTGAVGQFSFTSKIVPTSAGVNEPITWTLELSGTGNWPDIAGLPTREVSNDFSVVQPKSRRTMKEGSLFEGSLTEDVVLVPTRPGTYTLGPVKFTYFDPKTGSYRTLSTDTVTVTVGGAPTPAAAPAGVPQFSLTPNSDPAPLPNAPPAVAPVPPERLPRDPIEPAARGLIPWRLRSVVYACVLVAIVPPLLTWLVLAALRSRATDRARRRREARENLARILRELRRSGLPPPALREQLRLWQRETATLWELAHAAPGAPLVQAGVNARAREAAPTWAKLWHEADRALHGRDGALPTDWILRAEGALQAVRVPAWSFFSLFAPRNLFPFATALLLTLLVVGPATLLAQSAAESYRSANYVAAEKGWRTAVQAAPADWTARHNLGLALAQQDRWAEAAAHWTSGFLLHPRAEATRWDLALGLQQSGMAPEELVAFSRGENRHAIAREASAGEWQVALVGASLLLALGISLLLLHGFGRVRGWALGVGLAFALSAVGVAGAATLSLHTYGQLAHPEVALVWKPSTLRSIPTEADAAQKTTPLSAGSVAVVDRSFLGWSRLVFPGGQTGWVRHEDLLSLYR